MTSGNPSVWSECRWVMKAILRATVSKPLTPFLRAAAACRTTPVPRSTRYGVPLTTIAVEGPERSGSGNGVPVPSRTIWVVGVDLLCAGEMPCQKKRQRSASSKERLVRHFVVVGVFPRCSRDYAVVAAASGAGAARSKSHSLFGHAITGPAFRFFSTRYSLPQVGHFSASGLCAEVNLHFG